MKTIYNTLTTAALTVLLFVVTPAGPVLANVTAEPTHSLTTNSLSESTTLASAPLSGLQAMALGTSSMPPLPNEPKQRYKMMDSGGATVCAIRAGGRGIDCYGFDQLQQAEPPKGTFKTLSMGLFHGCAATPNGKLKCWGNPDAYPTPEESKNKRYTQISAGNDHTCARTPRGELKCWGNNDFGELNVPPGRYIDVSAKSDHTCAIDKANSLRCWGDKAFTSYGPFPGQYTDVSTGNLHVCALRQTDKRAVCWGNNAFGQATPPIDEFVSLTSGSYHTCGQRADKTATCWGKNDYGQVTWDSRRFAQIAAGSNLTCGLVQGSRRLTCQGSFAFNDNLFKHGQKESTLSQSGIVRPQSSLDSWLSDGLNWFGSSLSDGLETFFDNDLSTAVKVAKYGNIAFGLASFLISNLLEAEDPNEARFKEIQQQLEYIKTSLTDISNGILVLNKMLASTNYMVATSWCDNRMATLETVEKDIREGYTYKGPIGNWRNLMDYYQVYLKELENLKKTSLETKQPIDQAVLDQKLTAMLAKVDQYKKEWLSETGGKNIERMRHDLTDMLLGKTATSPLEACKAKSYQAWKSSPNLYPFDDRPIWAEASKVFIKSMNIQDQIADIETGVNAFEMMRVFQAPMKDAQGNLVPTYHWEPKEGEQGICKLAQSSQYNVTNPRLKAAWGSDTQKGPCQFHQDLVKDIYLGQVRQFEAMGGAYSDDNVVLSMTSQQLGIPPSDDNRGQSNWLWFRDANKVPVREAYKDMTSRNVDPTDTLFGVRISKYTSQKTPYTGSPFIGLLPESINGEIDFRQYLNPPTIEGNTWGEYVWHSNGQAWLDVFQVRKETKDLNTGEKDRYEDFMESMSALKDPVKSCQDTQCAEVKVTVKDTGEVITIRQPDESGKPAFLGLSGKAFWVSSKAKDDSIGLTGFDMRLKSFGGSGSFAFLKLALPCFMAEKINDGRNSDATGMDGYSWYHPLKGDGTYDQSKREYLKLSGKVCGNNDFAALLRTNPDLGWKWGVDCNKQDRCYGLGAFFPVNPKFDKYKEFFGGDDYKVIYENAAKDMFSNQWGVQETTDNMNLYHMPVVKVSGMPCNPKLMADNIEAVGAGQAKEPVYSVRSGERSVGDGKTTVPSICGNNLDQLINRYVPRSPYIDMPGIRTISAQ